MDYTKITINCERGKEVEFLRLLAMHIEQSGEIESMENMHGKAELKYE